MLHEQYTVLPAKPCTGTSLTLSPHIPKHTEFPVFPMHMHITSCWLAGRTLVPLQLGLITMIRWLYERGLPLCGPKNSGKSCKRDGTIFSLLTSFTKCKGSHGYDVLCVHRCPDVSKDFPFVQPDLFTRVNAFECMFLLLKMYSVIKYAVHRHIQYMHSQMHSSLTCSMYIL